MIALAIAALVFTVVAVVTMVRGSRADRATETSWNLALDKVRDSL